MGIGKLYFWATGLLGVYMCLGTHYKNYDGNWHRPRNQYKKENEKAKQAAEAKAEKLASELELDSTVASDNTRRHRRRDDTPTPAPRRSRRDGDGSRARSRAPDASARRRNGRGHGRGRDRESDRSSSIAVGDSHAQYRASHASKQHAAHRSSGGGARVKPTPYSAYVPEDDIFSPGPPSPLQPVNSTRHYHGYRKPADFAMEDHNKPGHTTRNGSYAPYKHLYGGYDDQYHAPFEGM